MDKRLKLKKNGISRLALIQYLDSHNSDGEPCADAGARQVNMENEVTDLVQRHREHLLKKIQDALIEKE